MACFAGGTWKDTLNLPNVGSRANFGFVNSILAITTRTEEEEKVDGVVAAAAVEVETNKDADESSIEVTVVVAIGLTCSETVTKKKRSSFL